MSFYSKELPKTVSSVNGKNNAVTIESTDNSIIVDNSQQGKIRLSSNGDSPSGNYVKWTNGNQIANPSIQLIGTDPTTGDTIHITSAHDTVIETGNKTTISAGVGIELNTWGDYLFTNTKMTIDANGVTFTDTNSLTNYGKIVLHWGFIGTSPIS
jgi:hypothetical protein